MEFNRDKYIRRLRELSDFDARKDIEIAKDIGISRSSLSKYKKGTTMPDLEILVRLAQTFGVTTDYLLGVTDIKATNVSERFICEKIGLTPDAVKKLEQYSTENRVIIEPYLFGHKWHYRNNTLCQLVENRSFFALIEDISKYVQALFGLKLQKKVSDELAFLTSEQEDDKPNGRCSDVYADKCTLALYSVARETEAITIDIANEYEAAHQEEMDILSKEEAKRIYERQHSKYIKEKKKR